MVQDFYFSNAKAIDRTDGLSISFENWRFNLRSSNTELLVRLNVETMGDRPLLDAKKEELTKRLLMRDLNLAFTQSLRLAILNIEKKILNIGNLYQNYGENLICHFILIS